jgi:hypothetical protein
MPPKIFLYEIKERSPCCVTGVFQFPLTQNKMATTSAAPSRTQFKDKSKPAEVRSSNIVAAKGKQFSSTKVTHF